tara:strand:- start:567 stop:791 length:225 start_codon:yes stop_codon:yes gene_type:complete
MGEVKFPFPDAEIGEEPEVVHNRFGGDSIELTPKEVAVYDVIMGAETLGQYDVMRKGIDWFIETNIKAYMTLLD